MEAEEAIGGEDRVVEEGVVVVAEDKLGRTSYPEHIVQIRSREGSPESS